MPGRLELGCPEIPCGPDGGRLLFGLKFAGRYIPVGGAISTGVRMQNKRVVGEGRDPLSRLEIEALTCLENRSR